MKCPPEFVDHDRLILSRISQMLKSHLQPITYFCYGCIFVDPDLIVIIEYMVGVLLKG